MERENGEVTRLDMLLIERVEHRPGGRTCGVCRCLGEPLRVTERGGARRLRRACRAGARPHTDPDWPACERFAPACERFAPAGAHRCEA
jgi:hypothetical protein